MAEHKKELEELYTKFQNAKNDEEFKKYGKQFQEKVVELRSTGSKDILQDGDIESWNNEISQKLEKLGETPTNIYDNQVDSKGEIRGTGEIVNDKIFKWPEIADNSDEIQDVTLEQMIEGGDNFISSADDINKINNEKLKSLTGNIYNILLEIGVGISVIIGLILGIKFMLSGVEEKAQVKKMLWVYVIGCIITFGSFGIWKIVVETVSTQLVSETSTDSEGNEQGETGGSSNDQGTTGTGNQQSAVIRPKKIRITEKEVTLQIGQKTTLIAMLSPANITNRSVVWKSSDPSVVSVDYDGKITAKKVGNATITVASVSNPKLSATCKVTVEDYKQTAANLLKALDRFSKQVQSDYAKGKYWTYHWVKADTTFEKAMTSGRRHATCVMIVRWGLMEIGALKGNMYYGYTSGTELKSWQGGKEYLKQYADTIEVKSQKTPADLEKDKDKNNEIYKLRPGDIIGWTFHHMSIYAGNQKFYDAGRVGTNGCTDEYDSFKTFGPVSTGWNNHVKYIIRLKR